MQKRSITLFLIAIITLTIIASVNTSDSAEYLRIHIRANSNSEIDQSVKYKIKNEVVDFLTPYIANCNTKNEAISVLNSNLDKIESVCNKALKDSGFSYESNASIKTEMFPTRVYEDFTLNSGFYDALIVELGEAKGDNWWCVVYPPLCFTKGNNNVKYKSKILEIIDNFKKEKGE